MRVIDMVFEMCVDVTECHSSSVYTLWLCGSLLDIGIVYCMDVWKRVMYMVCVLYGGVAACYMYGVCNLCWGILVL